MTDQDIKKLSQKINCEVCDKVLCKNSMKKHMETQHNRKEDPTTKIDESTKKTEEHVNREEESTKRTEEQVNLEEESTKRTDESDKTEEESSKKTESNKKTEPTQEPVIIGQNLMNLNTEELENLLEQEEDFLDAVENLENDIGLDVNLSVNESLVLFMQDEKNYRSDFARTMELEQVEQSRKEKVKLEIELENSKKTIAFLRLLNQKDKNNIKSLKEGYVTLNNKYRTSTKIVKKLEYDLKSSRDLLAKTSSENVQVKQKISTKESLEVAAKENKEEDIIVIDDATNERNMLACDKCDFVSKSKEAKVGHEKYIHLNCHVCRKHCDTHTELNAHIEHVHKFKEYDCEWCRMSFPNHTGFEVHRKENHEDLHKCNKCNQKFQKKEQLSRHIETEHIFKCFFKDCGLLADTEIAMIKHVDEDHLMNTTSETTESNQKPKLKECRYYKQGRCFKGEECKFQHIESKLIVISVGLKQTLVRTLTLIQRKSIKS